MKKILEFNIPEDDHEFYVANKGQDYWSLLWELDQECRSKLKHGHKMNADDVLNWIREEINYVGLEE